MKRILVLNINKEIDGRREIKVKSKKEAKFIEMLENNDNVLRWGYEKVRIKYRNPYTGKNHKYIVDFIVFLKNGLVKFYEIKSKNESYKDEKINDRIKKLNYIKIKESRKIGINVELIFL